MNESRRERPVVEDEKRKQAIDQSLDEALEETFPASDPIAPALPLLDEREPGKAA